MFSASDEETEGLAGAAAQQAAEEIAIEQGLAQAAEGAQEKVRQLLAGVDLAKLTDMLQEGMPRLLSCRDKAVVVVLGRTGAGKTTLISYLQGHELEYVDGGVQIKSQPGRQVGDHVDRSNGLPYHPHRPEIGKLMGDSETLFPATYSEFAPAPEASAPAAASSGGQANGSVAERLHYMDYPGYFDTRTRESNLLADIFDYAMLVATHSAFHRVRSIRGIVVVIDLVSLEVDKGQLFFEELKVLSENLYGLFGTEQPSAETMSALQFVFNRRARADELDEANRQPARSAEQQLVAYKDLQCRLAGTVEYFKKMKAELAKSIASFEKARAVRLGAVFARKSVSIQGKQTARERERIQEVVLQSHDARFDMSAEEQAAIEEKLSALKHYAAALRLLGEMQQRVYQSVGYYQKLVACREPLTGRESKRRAVIEQISRLEALQDNDEVLEADEEERLASLRQERRELNQAIKQLKAEALSVESNPLTGVSLFRPLDDGQSRAAIRRHILQSSTGIDKNLLDLRIARHKAKFLQVMSELLTISHSCLLSLAKAATELQEYEAKLRGEDAQLQQAQQAKQQLEQAVATGAATDEPASEVFARLKAEKIQQYAQHIDTLKSSKRDKLRMRANLTEGIVPLQHNFDALKAQYASECEYRTFEFINPSSIGRSATTAAATVSVGAATLNAVAGGFNVDTAAATAGGVAIAAGAAIAAGVATATGTFFFLYRNMTLVENVNDDAPHGLSHFTCENSHPPFFHRWWSENGLVWSGNKEEDLAAGHISFKLWSVLNLLDAQCPATIAVKFFYRWHQNPANKAAYDKNEKDLADKKEKHASLEQEISELKSQIVKETGMVEKLQAIEGEAIPMLLETLAEEIENIQTRQNNLKAKHIAAGAEVKAQAALKQVLDQQDQQDQRGAITFLGLLHAVTNLKSIVFPTTDRPSSANQTEVNAPLDNLIAEFIESYQAYYPKEYVQAEGLVDDFEPMPEFEFVPEPPTAGARGATVAAQLSQYGLLPAPVSNASGAAAEEPPQQPGFGNSL